MDEGDSFSLRADAWAFVDESQPQLAALPECRVNVVNREADVVDPRASPGDEPPDGRVVRRRLKQLHETLARGERAYPRPVGICHLGLVHAEHVPAESEQAVD